MTNLPPPLQRFWEFLLDVVFRPSVEHRLVRALKRGDTAGLEKLLDRHAWDLSTKLETYPRPPAPDFWRDRPRYHNGFSLLHVAAGRGQLEVAEMLVARGAAVDALTDWGFTPALLAAFDDNAVMVAFLASQGANLNHQKPNQSSYVEDGYRGATVLETLNQDRTIAYHGGEYAQAKAQRLGERWAPLPVTATTRPRL